MISDLKNPGTQIFVKKFVKVPPIMNSFQKKGFFLNVFIKIDKFLLNLVLLNMNLYSITSLDRKITKNSWIIGSKLHLNRENLKKNKWHQVMPLQQRVKAEIYLI